MSKSLTVITLAAVITCAATAVVFGWGRWGHNHINKGAILALPKGMGMFFYNHSDFITEESAVPDIRKHTINDKAETPRHYIDLEKYDYTTASQMPQTLDEAIKKYGKDTLNRYGILPWYIEDMMEKLTDAFRRKSKTEILFLAADLGHYVGDAHMPLHTTVNHDGQLTGQSGIHAFWESQLPELFGNNYRLYVPEAHYITNIRATTWNIIDSSYRLVDTLLHIEYRMRHDNPEDKQYVMGPDGSPVKNEYGSPVHRYEYAHVYHELLNNMVERQMRLAIQHTADYWYTAWVNAGKPDLTDLDPPYITERNKPFYREDMKAFRMAGKVRGFRTEKEFPTVGH